MKTTHEILDETANHYTLLTRSLNKKGKGSYNGLNERTCAIGRMLINHKAFTDDTIMADNIGPEHFKEEYRGHDRYFYYYVQRFHDTQEYWDETGLSELGISRLGELKGMYPIVKREKKQKNRKLN